MQADRCAEFAYRLDRVGNLNLALVNLRATVGGYRISDVRSGYGTEETSAFAGARSNDRGLRLERCLDGLRFFDGCDFASLAGRTNRIDLLLSSRAPGRGQLARNEVVTGVAVLHLNHVAGLTQAGNLMGQNQLRHFGSP